MAPLQVLIEDSSDSPIVAGLPCALRSAQRACQDLSPGKIVFCGGVDLPRRYPRQLASISSAPMPSANGEAAAKHFDGSQPLLVIGAGGFPREDAIKDFVGKAGRSKEPSRWIADEGTVAVYYPRAADALSSGGNSEAVARKALRESVHFAGIESAGWLAATDRAAALRAEETLCAGLAKDTDGYIARFDRKFSIALSRALLRTPITPNDITTASLVLGLVGAWWLASGSQLWQFIGALVLWFCCILDGCDGEVARLKLLCSPSGAAYDLWADHLAHLATFVAIPFGVHRMFPGANFLIPGILLVAGFLGCGFSVWWLVLRKKEEERGPYSLLIERVASRDYVYLIVVLTAIGHMDWFLWTASVGSHVFYLALWWISRSPKSA